MSLFNNITQDFYDNINKVGSNPFVLVVLIFIILMYYILFAFLGNSNENSGSYSGGGFIFIEAILWAVLVLLVFMNGVAYFFNINIVTELKNIFNKNPEIDIKSILNKDINNDKDKDKDKDKGNGKGKGKDKNMPAKILDAREVYHIPGNRFTYHDAKAVCKAFDGELADHEQLKHAQKKGASWCSYGWTKDQLGLYPTSQSTWNTLKSKEGHKYDCGLPGINGGYVSNPHVKLGSNCYGYKPKMSDLESDLLNETNLYPKTNKEKLFDERVDYWKTRVGNVLISPFNNNSWFKIKSS